MPVRWQSFVPLVTLRRQFARITTNLRIFQLRSARLSVFCSLAEKSAVIRSAGAMQFVWTATVSAQLVYHEYAPAAGCVAAVDMKNKRILSI